MAPSRGSILLLPARGAKLSLAKAPTFQRRSISNPSRWTDLVSNPKRHIQSYLSRTNDPFLNLSFENYLLTKSPPDSTILFMYINRPSIIIGRNQNPWLEVNLALLRAISGKHGKTTEPPGIGKVDLVRRISGGGTVFHDGGNVNWTVICPPVDFTRDKHAELVTRALRKLGVQRARVNERHDIVLDQGSERRNADENDTHGTPFTSLITPLKVSGSAYKLTRTRALHHGTCLLNSPNLNIIPDYLHSPAKPFIEARGVESVSSPVGNIGLEPKAFMQVVQNEFKQVYDPADDVATEWVEDGVSDVDEVAKMMSQLKSPDWTFCQTPQFTLSSDPYSKAQSSSNSSSDLGIFFKVRHGIIEECRMRTSSGERVSIDFDNTKLHSIYDWSKKFSGRESTNALAKWLSIVLPPVDNLYEDVV